ncbi:hypothetical protein AMTRI_Chr11g94140 [Amborella trichopoda]
MCHHLPISQVPLSAKCDDTLEIIVFRSSRLEYLKVEDCDGLYHIKIHSPNLLVLHLSSAFSDIFQLEERKYIVGIEHDMPLIGFLLSNIKVSDAFMVGFEKYSSWKILNQLVSIPRGSPRAKVVLKHPYPSPRLNG